MEKRFVYRDLYKVQRSEITEYQTYRLLANASSLENKRILLHIASDEKKHYFFWKKYTKKDFSPNWPKVYLYFLFSKILGLTFAIGLMEKKEECTQLDCKKFARNIPDIEKVLKNERRHEKELVRLIEEEKQKYTSSIVLGISDALIELTGTLAGLTFALHNSSLIAIAGIVTGIAAALSMASSEYLSTRSEHTKRKPLKAAFYTGIIYLFTVIVLVTPFFIFSNVFLGLFGTVLGALLVIAGFSYYVSIVQRLSFRKRFLEMTKVSLSVAFISFIIGYFLRIWLAMS